MTQLINRRSALFGLGATGLGLAVPSVVLADACNPAPRQAGQCDDVPYRSFQNGTIDRGPDCYVDFRLPDDMVRAITRTEGDPTGPAGTYSWTMRLIWLNSQNQPTWQQAHRVDNTPVRRQGVYYGTTVATYITCDEYTGWYAIGPVRSCGQLTLRRVDWPFDYRQLERMTS